MKNMGKKSMTAIMAVSLIHEVILLIGTFISAVSIIKLLGSLNLISVFFMAGSSILGIIIASVLIILTVSAIGYIRCDEINTVLLGAIRLSIIVNFLRALFYSLRILTILRMMPAANTFTSANGQLNVSLLITSGHGVWCLAVAALMVVMLLKMPKTEDE